MHSIAPSTLPRYLRRHLVGVVAILLIYFVMLSHRVYEAVVGDDYSTATYAFLLLHTIVLCLVGLGTTRTPTCTHVQTPTYARALALAPLHRSRHALPDACLLSCQFPLSVSVSLWTTYRCGVSSYAT